MTGQERRRACIKMASGETMSEVPCRTVGGRHRRPTLHLSQDMGSASWLGGGGGHLDVPWRSASPGDHQLGSFPSTSVRFSGCVQRGGLDDHQVGAGVRPQRPQVSLGEGRQSLGIVVGGEGGVRCIAERLHVVRLVLQRHSRGPRRPLSRQRRVRPLRAHLVGLQREVDAGDDGARPKELPMVGHRVPRPPPAAIAIHDSHAINLCGISAKMVDDLRPVALVQRRGWPQGGERPCAGWA